jgi:hypothetical protein
MKHHSELITEDQLKQHSGYQEQADRFVGQKIKSVWVGKSLGAVQIETESGVLRVNGFDYPTSSDAGVFISSNVKGDSRPPEGERGSKTELPNDGGNPEQKAGRSLMSTVLFALSSFWKWTGNICASIK